jgi:hypothetical protein
MLIDEENEENQTKRNKLTNKKRTNLGSNNALPSFEKFCKMNYVFVPPKRVKGEVSVKAGGTNEFIKFINDTVYEKKVRKKLLKIYEFYWKKFERISEEVISSKYQKIYDNIHNFMNFLKFCKESFIRTIILNTDQNANDFFQSMENYFDRKSGVKKKSKKKEANEFDEEIEEIEENKMIFFLTESRFKDMKSLYKYLDLCDNNLICVEDGGRPAKKKMRLLIIREIHKVDTINFNIFISRILEYHQDPYSPFYYVLIFDVSYDPRGLFEKIKPNNLCKMVFNNIENVSSRNIYKEILYKFIYEESESLFVPNPVHTKKIVDYVNNHQISNKSFKHYFKFILIDFFLLNSWKRDEYLIYSESLEYHIKNYNLNLSITSNKTENSIKSKKKEKKNNFTRNAGEEDDQSYKKILEKIFWKELNDIYGSYEMKSKNGSNDSNINTQNNNINNNFPNNTHKQKNPILFKKSDVEYLVEKYNERRRIIDAFLHFYQFFENLTEEISTEKSDLFYDQPKKEKEEKFEIFDKFEFFFDFLQFGADSDIAAANRTLIIKKSFENTVDYIELIKKIAEKFEKCLETVDDSCKGPHEMLNELHKIINEKGAKVRYSSDRRINSESNFLPLLDKDVYKRRLTDWLNDFFKMEEFVFLFEDFNKNATSLINEKRPLISPYSKYVIYHEIVNPSLATIVIEAIQSVNFVISKDSKKSKKNQNQLQIEKDNSEKENCIVAIEETIDFTKCNQYVLLQQFVLLFSQAPTEFKLKILFFEFLLQLSIDKENKDGVTKIKYYFLYFCHVFYLLGLISKKRSKEEVYLKNYYQMTSYFVKR